VLISSDNALVESVAEYSEKTTAYFTFNLDKELDQDSIAVSVC
jgi:hypothetical protein